MKPSLVAILNLTPDSFSDGLPSQDDALSRAGALMEAGASVLDIGAESTRPGATTLSAAEEWERLSPYLVSIIHLAQQKNVKVSVDTRHAETAARAILLGVDWINDVSGLTDPAMLAAVIPSPVQLVCMHSLGIPADPSYTLPEGRDVCAVVRNWAKERISFLKHLGADISRIIIDPGIGFGKTAVQSLALIQGIETIQIPGVSLLVGHSRKSFIRSITGIRSAPERDLESCIVSCFLAQKKVAYLRVHDISLHARALAMNSALEL